MDEARNEGQSAGYRLQAHTLQRNPMANYSAGRAILRPADWGTSSRRNVEFRPSIHLREFVRYSGIVSSEHRISAGIEVLTIRDVAFLRVEARRPKFQSS